MKKNLFGDKRRTLPMAALFFGLFLTLGSSDAAAAEDAAKSSVGGSVKTLSATNPFEDEILRFRYWMVPAESIEQWPWGSEKYYPVPFSDFEKWIREFQNKERFRQEGLASAGLAELRLSARLEDDALVDGSASARFALPTSFETPFLLAPCSLSLSTFTWEDGSNASVGLYPDGQIYLAHPRSEQLSFHWSLAGHRDVAGDLTFDLAFISSPRTVVELELPEGAALESSSGVVRSVGDGRLGMKKWAVYPGDIARLRLTVVSDGSRAKAREKTGYQQEISYRLAPEGIDLVSRFVFDRRESQFDEVTVICDQPLLTTSVEWKSTGVPAKILSRIDSLGTTKLQVRLPDDPSEKVLELEVAAFCSPKSGNHWRLPGVRILSESVLWKETRVQLQVDRPLRATDFETVDSVQTFDRFAASETGSEHYAFKYYQPNATVSVLLAEDEPTVVFDSMDEVYFDSREISVRSEILLTCEGSEARSASLAISKNWDIETVKESASETLYWDVDTSDPNRNWLNLSLKKPFSAERPARLELTGRCLGTSSAQIALEKLWPLDLSRTLSGRHLLSFHASAPYRVRLMNLNGQPLEPTEMNESDLRRFQSRPTAQNLIAYGPASADVQVCLDQANPAYTAAIDARIGCSRGILTEDWRVTCSPPVGGRVDRVLAAFSMSRPTAGIATESPVEWTWNLASEKERTVTAIELSDERRDALGLPNDVVIWEIRLSTSRSVPFEIQASRSRPFDGEVNVPLLMMPDSTSQTAELTLDSDGRGIPNVETERLRSIRPTLPPRGEYESAVAAFRYDPNELRETPGGPELVLTSTAETDDSSLTARAWCWYYRLDSQFDPNGIVRNALFCSIENHGRREMTVTLPAGLDSESVQAVWADDQRITWYPEKMGDAETVRVVLPEKRRYVALSFEYHYQQESLALKQRLVPKMPKIDMEILSGGWVARIPPEYAGYQVRPAGVSGPLREMFRAPTSAVHLFGDILPTDWIRSALAAWAHRDTALYRELADGFLERLGNPSTAAELLARRRVVSGDEPSAVKSGLTWGEIFSDDALVVKLFPTSVLGRPLRVFVNRYALARSRILPTDEITLSDLPTAAGRTLGAMETDGVVLLFVRPDIVYVTTTEERQELGDAVVSLGSDWIGLVQNRAAADEITLSTEPSAGPNVVAASEWNAGAMGALNPWKLNFNATGFSFVTPGWNSCRTAIDDAPDGILVINRYQLAAQKWFFFLAAVVLTWRGPLARPTFLLAVIGTVPALFGFVPPTVGSVLSGILLGAICSLGFYLVRRKRTVESSEHESTVYSPLRRDESSSDDSEPGFVPLDRIRPKELAERPAERLADAAPAAVSDTVVPPKESGKVSLTLLILLAFAACLFSCGVQLFGGQEPVPEEKSADEPYRVFVPYDEQRRPKENDYVWIPEPFRQKLSSLIESQENLENPWRLTSALYEGTVNYNSFTQTFSLFHLKAVYTVEMETSRAMIRLPMMSLPPDGGALFDRQPIYPAFQDEQRGLVFDISAPAGRHTLELTLTPPQFGVDRDRRIEMAIPRIHDARLELTVPSDTPPIQVVGACGLTRRSGDLLTARLGPTDRIILERFDDPGRIGQAQVEVEQLFLLRARPNQTSLQACFRFRITGGRVQALYLQNDPRYFLTRCSCDDADTEPSIQRESYQSDLIRIVFKKPVSGNLTLRTDYVVRDFSGIGQVRPPRIRASRSHVTRSWLALVETPSVEFDQLLPSDVSVGAFQNAWGGQETPLAVYDLLRTDPSWGANIRLKAPRRTVRENVSFLFDAGEIQARYEAVFQTTGETFRLAFRTPEIFQADSVELVDLQGNRVEPPERYAENGRLRLFFHTPLLGEYRIVLCGRLKLPMDKETPFPMLAMENVEERSTAVEIFYHRRVRLQFKPAVGWVDETESAPQNDLRSSTVHFAGRHCVPDPLAADDAAVTVEFNLPTVTGRTRAVLFNRLNDRWEILTDFFLEISDGEIDRFAVEWDELCTGPITVEPNLPFRIEENDSGGILTVTPKRPVSGRFFFRVRSPISRLTDTVRLPRLRLIPTGVEETTLPASVFLPAVDQLHQTRYQWDVENLRAAKSAPLLDGWSDGETAAADESVSGTAGPPETSGAVSALMAAAADSHGADLLEPEEFPALVTQLSGLTEADFYLYESTGDNYHATFSPGQNARQILGSGTVFFIRQNGGYYGETILDARLGKTEEVILLLPKSGRILNVTLDGVPTPVADLGGGRWRLRLLNEMSSRRITVLFELPSASVDKKRIRLGRDNYSRLDLTPARIENVPSLRSYWTATFESEETAAVSPVPCYITQTDVGQNSSANLVPPGDPPSDLALCQEESGGWKIPIPYDEALPILLRLSLEKMEHLLDLLESFGASQLPNEPDSRRWFDRWLVRWWNCQNEVRSQFVVQKTPMSFSPRQKAAIFQSIRPQGVSLGATAADGERLKNSFLLREATERDYLELQQRCQRLAASVGRVSPDETAAARNELLSSFSFWRLNHRNLKSLFLVGVTNADMEEITLFMPDIQRHELRLNLLTAFGWLVATALMILWIERPAFRAWVVRRFHLAVLLAGVLISATHSGPVGWILIAAAFLWFLVLLRGRRSMSRRESPSGAIVVLDESEGRGD